MQKNVLWRGLDADTTENCSVTIGDNNIIVRSDISGWIQSKPITAGYYIKLNTAWQVLEFDISFQIGSSPQRRYALYSSRDRKWKDSLGIYYPEFDDCSYIDITLTPFTNSLPVNGFLLKDGESRQVDVLYVDVMGDKLSRDRQVYTRITSHKYRFENDNGNFTAEIDVDDAGIVTYYPKLFKIITMEPKQEIIKMENRLIEAMKTSNITELDLLIDDDLIFTGHDGRLYTKEMDLQAHGEGGIDIYQLTVSEQVVRVIDDIAIVSVRKDISGSFFGDVQVGIYRFTRVWKQKDGNWKIIAGHSTQVVH